MTPKSIIKTLEFLSTVGFAAGYFFYDIYTATGLLLLFMTLMVLAGWVLKEPISKLQFWSWVIVLIFGGATILLRDQTYIKWKPTVINGGFALALFISQFFTSKTVAERLLGEYLSAPAEKLRNLNLAAGCYTASLSALNLYVAFNFSEQVWVNFKIFGLMALNMAFFMGGYLYLAEYVKAYMEQQTQKK